VSSHATSSGAVGRALLASLILPPLKSAPPDTPIEDAGTTVPSKDISVLGPSATTTDDAAVVLAVLRPRGSEAELDRIRPGPVNGKLITRAVALLGDRTAVGDLREADEGEGPLPLDAASVSSDTVRADVGARSLDVPTTTALLRR